MNELDQLFAGVFPDLKPVDPPKPHPIKRRRPRTQHRFKFLDKFETDEAKAADLRKQYDRLDSLSKVAIHYSVSVRTIHNAMKYFKIGRKGPGGHNNRQRGCKLYRHNGDRGTLRELTQKYGVVPLSVVRCRVSRGMSITDALTTPKLGEIT